MAAALRLAQPMLDKGFVLEGLHEYTDATGKTLYWKIRLKHPVTREKWFATMQRLRRDVRRFEVEGTGSRQ